MSTRRNLCLRLTAVAALACGAVVATASPGQAAPRPAANAGTSARSATVGQLRDTGPNQRRWMSVPQSRIVENPYDFNLIDGREAGTRTQAQYSNDPSLPANFAYYHDDIATELPNAAGLYLRDSTHKSQLKVGLQDDFSTLDKAWTVGPNLTAEPVNGQLKMTVHDSVADSISRPLKLNIDRTPYLEVRVPRTEGEWSLQLERGKDPNVYVQRDTDATGTFTFDLRKVTDWHGVQQFTLYFVAIDENKPTYLDELRIVGVDSTMRTASSYHTAWQPNELPATARYDDGTTANTVDAFADTSTVTRALDVRPARAADKTVTVAGQLQGTPSYDPGTQILTVRADRFSYAVGFSTRAARSVRYYDSYVDYLMQQPARKPSATGFWAVELPLHHAGSDTPLGQVISFAIGHGATARAARLARAALRDKAWARAASVQAGRWNALLAKAPVPQDTAIHSVPTYGVHSGDVRREYYAAWTLLAANVLPPMPEVNYPYPQVANGKASLWVFGAPGAAASAQWESVLELQYYALIDPHVAWQAYRGLMTRVDKDGQMGGENLPSRKAQTAYVLYQLTGDTAALRSVYSDLRRHLVWEAAHPHWICCGANPPINHANERDADYVTSLLVDMTYAKQIAHVLGNSSDVQFWTTQRSDLLNNYLQWFWPTLDHPVQYVFLGEDGCDYRTSCEGYNLDVAAGLAIPELDDAHVAGLMNRFNAEYDPTKPFAGIAETRYPEYNLTSVALYERGMTRTSANMVNAYLRDVVRGHYFAEGYGVHPDDSIYTGGVRPSAFGALIVLNATLLKNGYQISRGWPAFVRLPGEHGGVSNVLVRGRRLDEQLQGSSIHVSGSLIGADCRRNLPISVGDTVSLPRRCAR